MALCHACKMEIPRKEMVLVPCNAIPHEEPRNLFSHFLDVARAFRFFAYHEKCLLDSHNRFLDDYLSNPEGRKKRLEFWVFRTVPALMDMLLLRGFVYLLVGLFLFFGGLQILLTGGADFIQSIFAIAGVAIGFFVLARGIPSLNVFLMNVFYRRG